MNRKSKAFERFSRFMQVMSDLLILNILWVICSLPIFTAGASTCAAYTVMLKIVRDEGSGTIVSFFKAFKENFKRGLLYELIVIAAAGILYVDITFAIAQEGSFRYLCLAAYGIMMAIVLIFSIYVFPLEARYSNTAKGTIKNAFLLAFCAPGKTILMWIITAFPIALLILLPFETFLSIAFFYFLFGVSLPMYLNAKILREIFEKFVQIKEDNINDQERSEEAR